MAVRNPSSFDSVGYREVKTSKPILSSTFDSLVDNQIYVLDQPSLGLIIIADEPWDSGNAKASIDDNPYFNVKMVDKCNDSGVTAVTYEVTALVVNSTGLDTGNPGSVEFESSGTSDTLSLTIPGATSTPTWLAVGEIDMETNGTADGLQVWVLSTGTDTYKCYAVAMFAKET